MARWDKISSRGNVSDRRGIAGAIGGIGITGMVGLLALNFLLGGDVGDALNILNEVPIEQQQVDTAEFEGEDEYEVFTSTVLGSLNQEWSKQYEDYREPKLVLFRNSTESECGGALSAFGPHYCPIDETIYLDETFFDELENRFGAEGGDVAEAYVIAHEVGHHIQKLQGILDANIERTNETQVLIELQADCYAGVWASQLKEQNILLPGEIREAMDAAAAVGDDHIQKTINGRVSPESWTHGSSEQRVNSFTSGYNSGEMESCARISYLK